MSAPCLPMDTGPRRFAFVVMPFNTEFRDVYELAIKTACQEASVYCERADEQIYEGRILERLYSQIFHADLIIAEMTGRNPNVLYEVGYAHAINKRVILLARDKDDIPFDLLPYPNIIYNGDLVELRDELTKNITWHMENSDRQKFSTKRSIEIFADGKPIETGASVLTQDPTATSIDVVLQNTTNRVLDGRNIAIALVLPRLTAFRQPSEALIVPGGRQLAWGHSFDRLLPQALHQVSFEFGLDPLDGKTARELHDADSLYWDAAARLFTDEGMTEVEFSIVRSQY